MAQLVELLGPAAWILLEVGVEPMHGVGAQQVRPGRVAGAALRPQVPADTRLTVAGPECGLRRSALRVEPARLGDHFDNRRLADAVLPRQHGDSGTKIQALGQDVRYRRHGRGPAGQVKLGAANWG